MIVELADKTTNVRPLLERAGLPHSDIIDVRWQALLGWMEEGTVVAAGGTEICDDDVLLRSVVVEPSHQGRGVGYRLVAELETRAAAAGCSGMYLLTLDAQDYFRRRFGYQEIERETAPKGIRYSSQFSGVCPESATLMYKAFR